MKLTIIFRDESREVECDNARVVDGMLFVEARKLAGSLETIQIWNMNNIIGVEMD